MKTLTTSALIALLTVCHLPSSAQGARPPINEPDYNKPKSFADLPEKQNLNLAEMEALLNLKVGEPVNAKVAPGFHLTGTVLSKSNPADENVKSVVIKSAIRQQGILTFTRITRQDGSRSYIGRMVSKGAGDALEIVKEGTTYVIRKKGFYDMINE